VRDAAYQRVLDAGTPVRLPVDDGEDGNLDEQLARQEKEMLLAALARAAGVKKKAATLLGINYRSFRHRLQKYGLDAQGDDMPSSGVSSFPRPPGH
jgi:DNA-binding NtrC family response regulator